MCFRYGRWYFVCLVHLVLSAFQNHRCAMKSNHLTIHLFSFSSSYTQSSNSPFFYNRFGTFWQKKNWTKICKGMPFNHDLKSGFYLIFPQIKDRVEIEVTSNYYLWFNLTTLCVFVSGSSNKTWSVIIYQTIRLFLPW